MDKSVWADNANTHRFHDGSLATSGTSKIKLARITCNGKVHKVQKVIIRWNFMGGTFEKPDVTFVMLCGLQRHVVFPAPNTPYSAMCVRCDNHNWRDR